MIQVGDIVKINIDTMLANGAMSSVIESYILENPDEVYEVDSIGHLTSLASIQVDHPIVGATSFFEDELILV